MNPAPLTLILSLSLPRRRPGKDPFFAPFAALSEPKLPVDNSPSPLSPRLPAPYTPSMSDLFAFSPDASSDYDASSIEVTD